MPAVIARLKREKLFREIVKTIDEWPEIERRIFSQAHYQGQSLEAISRCLQLDVNEVNSILRRCERRLHASLIRFREGGSDKPLLNQAETGCQDTREQELTVAHAIGARVNSILDASRISA